MRRLINIFLMIFWVFGLLIVCSQAVDRQFAGWV